jgi:hypothetical protein
MQTANHKSFRRVITAVLVSLFCAVSTLTFGQADAFQPNPAAGAGTIIVHSKFGGQIFGFDIDQNGTEAVLSEARTLSNGNVLAAVESFDQTTGKIPTVVTKTQTQDDFITLGVVGSSVGLVEHEHVVSFLNIQRTFQVINPLSGNKITGRWTPPIGTKHLINQVSRTQGTPNAAVFAEDNSGISFLNVFSSNVAANTFGPVIKITDSFNFGSVPPPMAYNSVTNQAVLGGGDGCFGCLPVIGVANLGKGTFTEFTGIGFGFVNGIAVDSADNIACATIEDDASVEFYDLSTQTGFTVVLPNSGQQQIFSGADVEFDATHKLFFVAQPVSSSTSTGSTIYVYDTAGNLQETLNGFSFSNASNVIAMHIALKPSTRSGFVDGPNAGVSEIQSFTY